MSTRRAIYIPDDSDLWERAQKAALEASVERGYVVSVSEWVRDAIREKLERDAA